MKKNSSKVPKGILRRLQRLFSTEQPAMNAEGATLRLIGSLEELFFALAKDFNSSIAHEPLMVSVRRSPSGTGELESGRLLVATSFWALSIRATSDAVLFFIVPSTELLLLAESELPSRLKLRLVPDSASNDRWIMDGSVVSADELNMLARSLLKDVITRSQGDYDLMPESMRMVVGGLSLSRSVKSLMAEKNALIQKIVNQQEAILNGLAREIHDAVLGNVMLLKSSLSGSKAMSDDAMAQLLEEISAQLRNICHDLYPRDLKDCGLKLMLEELCLNFQARTGCACEFVCHVHLPEIADEAALHIYRIAQECLNNVAKHATASRVELEMSCAGGFLTMSISDNGRGIEKALAQASHSGAGGDSGGIGSAGAGAGGAGAGGAGAGAGSRVTGTGATGTGSAVPAPGETSSGGTGTSIMRERADLIDCLYPTRFWLESSPERGTKVTLQIMFETDGENKPSSQEGLSLGSDDAEKFS